MGTTVGVVRLLFRTRKTPTLGTLVGNVRHHRVSRIRSPGDVCRPGLRLAGIREGYSLPGTELGMVLWICGMFARRVRDEELTVEIKRVRAANFDVDGSSCWGTHVPLM